jgi:uncharacterized repeat protein (TIGR03803 family)
MRFTAMFVVLAMSISTAHAATLTTLFSFNGQNGRNPFGDLITDASGNLLGTTFGGGASDAGTIFRLDRTGALTTLVSFNDLGGVAPNSGLIADASGSLLGSTLVGGASNLGTIFRLDRTGALTTLVSFNGLNGVRPNGRLIADASGNLFGATSEGGGRLSGGTIFRLDNTGALTTLFSFNRQNDDRFGTSPNGGLITDASGNLFGTTIRGGTFGLGSVFRLDTTGALTTLVSFNEQNGLGPSGGLIADASGNLFGATALGGAFGAGTVFRLDATGALTTLFSFNRQNGSNPQTQGSLLADASGNLFGTTAIGGAFGFGTVFRLDRTGTLTTLVSFNEQNGLTPVGTLIADASGNLFGATVSGGTLGFGTIFRISDTGFNVGAAVPEPATWAMMLFGFGLVGASLRKQQFGSASVTA